MQILSKRPLNASLKTAIRTASQFAKRRYTQYKHKQSASTILKKIEHFKGKTPLHVKKRCDEYASDMFGDKRFASWLYVYCAVAGEFKEGWIPDDFYGLNIIPKLKGAYGKLSRLKPLNFALLRSPLFPDLLSYANGVFFDKNYNYVPPNKVRDILFANHERVVFKLDGSKQGLGIHFFSSKSFDIEIVRSLGNGLFQGFIEQHPLLATFQKNSVATIRITTVYDDGGNVSVRACYLRLGRSSDTHVQSQSHIRVPIDLETGALWNEGFSIDWLPIMKHPDSGIEFSGKFIPSYTHCIHAVTELHKKLPYARCIGWDTTVDINERPQIIEWNGDHNGIKFSEATQGPCFHDLGWIQLSNQKCS